MPTDELTRWAQVDVEFPDYNCAATTIHTHLVHVLADTGGWWFIRKHPRWRIRHRTGGEHSVHTALAQLARDQIITGWYPVIYEPETLAFGGDDAMTVAHRLFVADSPTVLDLLTTPPGRQPGDVELSLLALSRLLRNAGLDWFEQADVWHRVTELRTHPGATPHPDAPATSTAIRRLLTLDTGTGGTGTGGTDTGDISALEPHNAWLTAYDNAGTALLHLARNGLLQRGLRAVLAHHVLFHWNRLCLDLRRQHALAALARDALLPPDREHP